MFRAVNTSSPKTQEVCKGPVKFGCTFLVTLRTTPLAKL